LASHGSPSSGEFHTFRLPVPSLWLDILQKVKAAGLNAVSVYTHWGLLNPAPGVVDFGSFRALQPLFDAALTAGIWVILRPGPYINAETTAGGIAHWVTSRAKGTLRTNATDFHDTWQDYIQSIVAQTVPNQITEGGAVIGKFKFRSCIRDRRVNAHYLYSYPSRCVPPFVLGDPTCKYKFRQIMNTSRVGLVTHNISQSSRPPIITLPSLFRSHTTTLAKKGTLLTGRCDLTASPICNSISYALSSHRVPWIYMGIPDFVPSHPTT
jgi:hypothetical protein